MTGVQTCALPIFLTLFSKCLKLLKGKRMEPVILGEIGACMHVLLLALCVNVSSKLRKTPGTWLAGCAGRMCLGELTIGLNPACLVAVPCWSLRWVRSQVSAWGCSLGSPRYLPDIMTMTKWFYSTRLETRTKESNICASSRVVNLLAQ